MFGFGKKKKQQEKRVNDKLITIGFLNCLFKETGKLFDEEGRKVIFLPYNYIGINYKGIAYTNMHPNIILYSGDNQIIFAGTNIFQFMKFFESLYDEKTMDIVNRCFVHYSQSILT